MRKRLVYRADDIGYTQAFDDGAFLAIDKGIATSADVMLDSKHTVEALLLLKERPWISVGWHRHLWGWPVLPAVEVPSMVNEQGKFKWRHDMSLQATATYEDCYKEFCAELDLCFQTLGRYPDSASYKDGNRPIDQAMKDVCIKYQLNCNFWGEISPGSSEFVAADEIYQHLNYKRFVSLEEMDNNSMEKHNRFDLAYFKDYTPAKTIMSVQWTGQEIWRVGGHPGYLDDYILQESTCNIHRVKDLEACIDPNVMQWIIDNKVELINQRDVLFGTSEYQDHLKTINSPLWIGNF